MVRQDSLQEIFTCLITFVLESFRCCCCERQYTHTNTHTKYVCADWDSWDHYSVWQQSKKALIPTGTAESAAKDYECHSLKLQPASLSDSQSAFILTRASLYQIWLIINRSQIWSADIMPFHTAICDSLMVSSMQCSDSTFKKSS